MPQRRREEKHDAFPPFFSNDAVNGAVAVQLYSLNVVRIPDNMAII
jgi:hypothetical protein